MTFAYGAPAAVRPLRGKEASEVEALTLLDLSRQG
jgi:hypothetical protein